MIGRHRHVRASMALVAWALLSRQFSVAVGGRRGAADRLTFGSGSAACRRSHGVPTRGDGHRHTGVHGYAHANEHATGNHNGLAHAHTLPWQLLADSDARVSGRCRLIWRSHHSGLRWTLHGCRPDGWSLLQARQRLGGRVPGRPSCQHTRFACDATARRPSRHGALVLHMCATAVRSANHDHEHEVPSLVPELPERLHAGAERF